MKTSSAIKELKKNKRNIRKLSFQIKGLQSTLFEILFEYEYLKGALKQNSESERIFKDIRNKAKALEEVANGKELQRIFLRHRLFREKNPLSLFS